VELVEQQIGDLDAHGVPLVELLEQRDELRHKPDQLVVRVVILTVLDEIPPQHVHLAQIVFVAPVEEVHPLEELGLVILELSHASSPSPRRVAGVLREQR
jgi:hypothetical protein